ncbi:MAG: hypothetical protein RQ723_07955 [Desulfuromonadales bacterium]|nr:hypothetical protein [Desulfuromonadales bacterium]
MTIELNAALLGLLGFALLSNVPLGFLRQGSRKFSVRWFVCIHLSIPFIIALRLANGISWQIIPFTFALAILGQIVGGRLRRLKLP